MVNFVPMLWKSKTNKQEEAENIVRWCEDEDTVPALERFAEWASLMSDSFPETMKDFYNKLKFERDREDHVVSPSGLTDWTFTVYVIRFTFMHLLYIPSHIRKSFEARALCIQLLDDMEKEMNRSDGERTPSPHRELPDRDTPDPEIKRPVEYLLLRLRDFIE